MKIAMFSTRPYDRSHFDAANQQFGHELTYLEPRLDEPTVPLAAGHGAVCAFVNDRLSREVLTALSALGVRLIALRSAGFNHVDLHATAELALRVVRVPAYSPHSVAEHAVALILSLNRKIHKAYLRVREANFSLTGLEGFELHGKTVGVVGTGKIGATFAGIMQGFGCDVLAHDPYPDPGCRDRGVSYVELEELLRLSDIISLHCPLNATTRHMIDQRALSLMKDGVMLINTGRGGLVDTRALITGLKSGKLGALGLDVYEEEEKLFFADHSADVIQDDVFMRLLTFPNVLVTAHQAFFTTDALDHIAQTTLSNVTAFETGVGELNEIAVS
jgi:D-lactate dehydrogenase